MVQRPRLFLHSFAEINLTRVRWYASFKRGDDFMWRFMVGSKNNSIIKYSFSISINNMFILSSVVKIFEMNILYKYLTLLSSDPVLS